MFIIYFTMCYFNLSIYQFIYLSIYLSIPISICREVAMDLIDEYKAAEKMDYVTWGGAGPDMGAAAGGM